MKPSCPELTPNDPGARVRVLVVEDHRPLADLVAEGLADHGHRRRVAYDEAEGERVIVTLR